MSRPLLELRGVAKGYERRPAPVLAAIDLQIAEGEFSAIVGCSGAGKTTLVSLIAGLTTPDRGEIRFAGEPIDGPSTDRAVVFQNYSLLPWLSVLGNVRLAVEASAPSLDRRQAVTKAERFIDLVKQSRGGRLKGPEKTLFSGEYWTGAKAIELGLADGIGDLSSTLRERFGEDVVTPLISAGRGWFGRVQPGVDTAHLAGLPRAADFAEEAISALEARALWARYGL